MTMRVLAPGLSTTLQDLGRTGSRHLGVGITGAMDAHSHTVANLLVGNPRGAATLEITLSGPTLALEHAATIAVCGADIDVRVDDRALPCWRPIRLPAGVTMSLGPCRIGARAYLAVAGGFRAPSVLGSVSTDLRGGFGGLDGRPLQGGDRLDCEPVAGIDRIDVATWWIDPSPDLQWTPPNVIRVLDIAGSPTALRDLLDQQWRVGRASDRQGLRLEGASILAASPGDGVSEPVAPGTIQLPADGQPIVLLADAQTHGGYPRIGHAIRADWPRLAQLRAGDLLHFIPCSAADARQARLAQAHRLARIALAVTDRLAIG